MAGTFENQSPCMDLFIHVQLILKIQVYFQRVLACRSSKQAQTISYLAGFGALVLAAPPICLGVIARVTGSLLTFKTSPKEISI